MVHLAVAALQQHRTLAIQCFLLVDDYYAQHREVLSEGHCIRMHNVPACDSDVIEPIACRSQGEVSRPRLGRGPLAPDLRPLFVYVDDTGST